MFSDYALLQYCVNKLHISHTSFSSKETFHTMSVLSERLIGIQENAEALPGETVTEVTDITETDIAKEQKVENEAQESIEPITVPG